MSSNSNHNVKIQSYALNISRHYLHLLETNLYNHCPPNTFYIFILLPFLRYFYNPKMFAFLLSPSLILSLSSSYYFSIIKSYFPFPGIVWHHGEANRSQASEPNCSGFKFLGDLLVFIKSLHTVLMWKVDLKDSHIFGLS